MIQFSGNYEIKLAPKRGKVRSGDHLEAAGAVMDRIRQHTHSPIVTNYIVAPGAKKPRISLLTNDYKGMHATEYLNRYKKFHKENPHFEESRKFEDKTSDFGDRDPKLHPKEMDFHKLLMAEYLETAQPVTVEYERNKHGRFKVHRIDFKG